MKVLLLLVWSQIGFSLSCHQVKQLVSVYLKIHYEYKEFDEELSTRTLDNFIKFWDPGKLYFYKNDVDKFRSTYAKTLNKDVIRGKCKAISNIVSLYDQRFEERQKSLEKLYKEKYDFKKKEFLELDRKKIEFSKTSEELDERWRKRFKFQLLQLKKTLKDKTLKKSLKKLKKRYNLVKKNHSDTDQDKIYSKFLNAFASALDPHSDYMSPDVLEDFRIQTRLSLEGIGAVLRSEDGFTIIQSLVAGGAAARSKLLKVEDKIIAVAQEKGDSVDVIDMDLREVVKLIRGKGGTKVLLTIVREKANESSQFIVPIVREKVQLTDRTVKSKVFTTQMKIKGKMKPYKIGVVLLPSFYIDFEGLHNNEKNYRSSARDLTKEINALAKQNVDAMILDLRTNGGGSLTESVKVAGLFFKTGSVVQIKDTKGNIYSQNDEDPRTQYAGPLITMISRQSASASEIVAGALKDYQRSIIVGDDHTFGKGTVQNLNEIGTKLGAIKVTISKFYRPSGASTQLKGVASDIVLPSVLQELEIGEKHYDYAMRWDKIKDTKFKKFNKVSRFVGPLQKRSSKRIKKDSEFDEIRKGIADYKKTKEEKSRVSLSEETKKEDKKEENEKDEFDENDPIQLTNDAHLQETLRIATDYAALLKNEPLGKVKLPKFKPSKYHSMAHKKTDDVKKKLKEKPKALIK